MGIKTILWNITNKCNLNCWHCYRESSPKSPKGTGNIDLIIKKISKTNVRNISISGGEPLLHKDVFKICKALQESNKSITLVTNATIISSENIHLIEKYVNHVQVSIDNFRSKSDEKSSKGVTSYQQKLAHGLSNLSTTLLPVTFTYVPNRFSYKINEYFSKLYFSNVKALIAQEAIRKGRAAKNESITVNREELNICLEHLSLIAKKYPIKVRFLIPKEEKNQKVVINENGDVSFNSFLENTYLGNLSTGALGTEGYFKSY